MPPKLNITRAAQYAQVDPAFIEMLKEIWKKRWSVMNNEIKVQPPQYQKLKAKNYAPTMSKLRKLCTDPLTLDKEITRLRGLPYERFYVRTYLGRKWLVGLTHPVVLTDDVRKWQAPRYFVYFPDDVVTRGTDAAFHFVPEGNEMTTARHPHHNVKTYYYDDRTGARREVDMDDIHDPLDYIPATCWGSFSTIASSCLVAGDIVDLYRNIGIYLTRVNQNSLLTRPFDACHFLKDIGSADIAKPATITGKTKFTALANGRVY